MYYTSTNKADLEAYNDKVVWSEGYDGEFTTDWAGVIDHPSGNNFAMVKHPKYDAELTLVETLGADWYPEELI